MLLLLLALLLPTVSTAAEVNFSNSLNRSTVVIAAPGFWDSFYEEKFFPLLNFDIRLVKAILKAGGNAVLIADKFTIPYLNGSLKNGNLTEEPLPNDVLLEGNIYDIWVRDFGPIGNKQERKFHYSGPDMLDRLAANVTDKSFSRFLQSVGIEYELTELFLDGSNFIENGENFAIVSEKVLRDNGVIYTEAKVKSLLSSATGYKKLAIIKSPEQSGIAHIQHVMSFLSPETVLVATFPGTQTIKKGLKTDFGKGVKVVELEQNFSPGEKWKKYPGVCGLHLNYLDAGNFILLPTFGQDPENQRLGLTSAQDEKVEEIVSNNSKKKVIAMPVPHEICSMGGGLRSLTWLLRDSDNSEKIVKVARLN